MKDLSRLTEFPEPKLVDCGGCGQELLGESLAHLGAKAQTVYGRPHVAGRVRNGERHVPLCRWCLRGEKNGGWAAERSGREAEEPNPSQENAVRVLEDFHEYGEPVG